MNNTYNYIDIHAHILPGVDDGPVNMEASIRIIRLALEQGVKTIIATPHYIAGEDNLTVEQLELIRDQLQAEADKLDGKLKIFLGNELLYSEAIIDALQSNKALTLAGSRYVLVEFPVEVTYDRLFRGFADLIRAGYIPVLAHVERYRCLYRKSYLINDLIKAGCYIQMNGSSLVGNIFNSDSSFNRKLVSDRLVHFIGSDCHDDRYRKPCILEAVKALRKKCDEELITQICQSNPSKVLENTFI